MTNRVNLTFLVDSNPSTGATNINALGSEFTVNMQPALHVPAYATNISVIVKNAIVWFVTPNVVKDVNDRINITYNGIMYPLQIPVGLYDVDTLSNKINSIIHFQSNNVVPIDLIKLLPDIAENKVVIQFNYYNTEIDFTVQNSIRQVLGFSPQVLVGYTGPGDGPIPFYFEGDLTARFNTTDYYLIRCSSLLSTGIQFNNDFSGIMCRIDVRGNINSKIDYDPNQVPIIPAPRLRNCSLSELTFQLVNQNGELVDTRGEYWSVLFELHFDVPLEATNGGSVQDSFL